MIAFNAITMPTAEEVRIEAVSLLIDKLGVAKAAMIIREKFSDKTDYLLIKEELFESKKVEDIYLDIQEWKKEVKE